MSIQVTVCPNPFSQERKEFNFEQGLSIQDILKKIDTKHVVNTGWRVLIDDEIITDFTRIPVEGQKVYIKLVPEGDTDNRDVGVGMKIGGGLLTAAGIIMMFTPAAPLGAAFIGAGIGVFSSGVILYNSDLNITDREKPEQDQSIRGSRNQSRPYGTLPVLFGRRRIYTDVCANPFTWVESDGSVYLYQLFCAGQKDIQIDTNTIKIDETLIKDYSASGDISKILDGTDELIHMSIASGASTSPLYNKCVHEIQLNSILKHETEEGLDGAVIRTTPKDTTSINVDIFFYNGLGKYDDDGDIDDVSVEVIAEYKQADEPDSSYTLLGYFSGSSNVITGHELKTKRCAITKTDLLPESYTVRITRVTNDSTSNRTIDAVYVGSIRAAKNENPVRTERCQQITQIGLKIKASEKLNNIVEQLNFVAESKLPVYKNGNWNTEELSRNPASAAMYAMKSEIAQQQLDNSEIDLDSFATLYTWCENHGYECNAYVTEDMTIKSLLSNIASTCRAEILRVNGKITVIQDIERSSYVQLFTPRNSFNYKESMLLSDIPDELKIQFVDEDSGYAENEASVYNTPDGNYDTEPETSQNITLWGVTNKDQAIKLGMYNYGASNHRFLVVKFSCDFEYLMCRKGDWIKFAGDIAIRGLKQGRITSSEGTRLFLDEDVTMESGKNYAIRIRTKPGECILRTVQNVPGTSNSVVVNGTALTDVDDCLFTFGISGNDSMDLIVTDIQCGDNLSADITCVEYCPEIFGVDDPDYELPDFVNKLSDVQSVIDPGTVAKWRTYTTYNDSESQPSTPSGDGTSSGWHHQQTENSKWVSTKTSESIEKGKWSAPIPTGKKVMDLLIPEGEITEPDDVRGLQAVAQENGILIKWYPVNNNGLNNTIQQYHVGISKDGGSTWTSLDNTTGTSITYNFQRNVDGYPESNNLSTWKVRVLAENIYGKFSNYTIINVDLASYKTWIPAAFVQDSIIAKAEKDGINLTWQNVQNVQIYGTPVYKIYRNGVQIGTSYSNNFFYQFDRTIGEYPESSDFTDSEWDFTIRASNESGNYIDSDEADYDISDYLTWLPSVPEVGITTGGRTMSAEIIKDDGYWGWKRYEVQISKDRINWYSTYTGNGDVKTSEEYWKNTLDSVTNILGQSFNQELPLEGQSASTGSVDTTYYYRFRAVTQVKDENGVVAYNYSSWTETITTAARATSVQDIVNNSINTEKLASGAVTNDKIQAGTITAEKISAIALNKINSLTGDDTAVGDDTAQGWSFVSDSSIQLDSTTNIKCLRVASSGIDSTRTSLFEVKPDEILKFSFTIDNTANNSWISYIGVWPVNYSTPATYMKSSYDFSTGKWSSWTASGNNYFCSAGKKRYSVTTYICGSSVDVNNIPSPLRSDDSIAVSAIRCFTKAEADASGGNPNYNKCSIRFGLASGSGTFGYCYLIAPLISSITHRGTVTADEVKTSSLSAITANLGDVAAGSIASGITNQGVPDPSNSLVYLNGHNGSEEFYIGNVSKGSASESTDSHEFLHFWKENSVYKFVLKISNIILSTLSTVVKGVFRVKKSISDTDANAFMTVNPTDSTDSSTPAKTMKINGDIVATKFTGSVSGNASTATTLQTARTINIKDSSERNTGTGASFNGSTNINIKLPAEIDAGIYCYITSISSGNATVQGNRVKENYLVVKSKVTGTITSIGSIPVIPSVSVNESQVYRFKELRGSSKSVYVPIVDNVRSNIPIIYFFNYNNSNYFVYEGPFLPPDSLITVKCLNSVTFTNLSFINVYGGNMDSLQIRLKTSSSYTFDEYNNLVGILSITSGSQRTIYIEKTNPITKVNNSYSDIFGNVNVDKLATARITYVTLGTASTSTTRDWSGTTTIPVSGTLGVANGGTGATSILGILNALRNSVTGPNAGVEQSNYNAYITASKFNTNSGYIVFSNGLKIQWGQTSNNVSLPTISLSIAFTSVDTYIVLAVRQSSANVTSGGGVEKSAQTYKISASQFKIDQYASSNHRSNWLAIGY